MTSFPLSVTVRQPNATMTHVHLTSLALGCTLAVSLAGCSHSSPSAPPANASAAIAVNTARVVERTEPDVHDAGGFVHARQSAVIASRVMASVREVLVVPGSRVRRGQTLVLLDGRDLAASARQAATMADASGDSVAAARAELDAARAAFTLARADAERLTHLAARKAATAHELETATAAHAAATARVAAAEAMVKQASSAAAGGGAARDHAAVIASFARLTAPFDGVVVEKRIDPGAMASPGQPLLRVEDQSRLTFDVRVDEAHASDIAVGSRVWVSIDTPDRAGRRVDTTVAEHAAGSDGDSRTVLVRLTLPRDAWLVPGQFGRAHLPGRSRPRRLVPDAALVRRGQLTSVFVVDGDVARLRLIALGRPQADAAGQTEVVSGLDGNERVVLNPPSSLRDGAAVRVTTGAPAGVSR